MWTHLFFALRDVVLPVVTFSAATTAVLFALFCLRRSRPAGTAAMLFTFALLGAAIGLFVGGSKTPVMGTVLPAVLTFLTALWGYLFGKDGLTAWRPVIPACVMALTITMMGGGFVGTSIVRSATEAAKAEEEWLMHYRKVQLPVARAAHFRHMDIPTFDPMPYDGYMQRRSLEQFSQSAVVPFAYTPPDPPQLHVPGPEKEEQKG